MDDGKHEVLNDYAVIADFFKRLDCGQLDGQLIVALAKLTYIQLLMVSRILQSGPQIQAFRTLMRG